MKLAIDIGGTYLRSALIKKTKLYNFKKQKIERNKKKLLLQITEAISSLNSWKINSIHISAPGPLEGGIIKNTPNIPLKNFDLKEYVEKIFHKKVFIENDAKCAALAELYFGCKKSNFIYITIGTGIGGGIIINKKLYRGQGFAGEWGHINSEKNKDFEKIWQENRTDFNKASIKQTKIISYNIGKLIALLINIFDPEIVIIGGGIKKAGNKFLNEIKNITYSSLFIPRRTPIKFSQFNEPSLIGASLLS